MRERRSYVILVFISVLLSATTFFFAIRAVRVSDHKFCQLINASLSGTPVPTKPADPKANPSRERLYDNYEIVHNLGVNLGCTR